MTARNLISSQQTKEIEAPKGINVSSGVGSVDYQYVDAELPVLEVFRRMMSVDSKILAVVEDDKVIGWIDAESMLEGLHNLIIPRDACSTIEIECGKIDFSASKIAHAVEDAEAHLLDMLSRESEDGKLRVLLRVSHIDPTSVVRSLERYDYEVVSAHGSQFKAIGLSYERLAELAMYLNV